jgi:hypothetical protein
MLLTGVNKPLPDRPAGDVFSLDPAVAEQWLSFAAVT